MPTNQLKLNITTNMFGTNVTLANRNKTISYDIGNGLSFNPKTKLTAKPLQTGYLFRSPNLDATRLEEIWPTIENFDGDSSFSAKIDTKTKQITAYMRIIEKSDATMFAYTHDTFEKWSDEKEAEANEKKKQKKPKVYRDANGNLKVDLDVVTLDTPDPV